jgi:GT2 family glycosyltransferase
MNSDLIVSRGWLKAMVAHMGKVDRLACLGNLSNCNIDWTLPANAIQPIQSKGQTLSLRAGMKIEEFAPHVEALNHFMAASNEQHKGVYHRREWVAAYCSLYARSAWDEVGGFDPIYKNGCEDLDHCIRLRKAGYEIGEAYDAFIFHAGGVSRGAYEQEPQMKRVVHATT